MPTRRATPRALEALLADPENDAVLVLNVPTAPRQRARGGAGDRRRRAPRPRQGFRPQARLRRLARRGRGLGARSSRRRASRISRPRRMRCAGFMQLVRYREAQRELMETPDQPAERFRARRRDRAAPSSAAPSPKGRRWLDPLEVNALLAAYAIPVAPVTLAHDAGRGGGGRAADPRRRAAPSRSRSCRPDIVHKSDIGGVPLDLIERATPSAMPRRRFSPARRG